MSDYGPQHEQVVAMIERTRTLASEEAVALGVAWEDAAQEDAWDAAWDTAWDTAWDAAWGADRNAAWGAAWDAARGADRNAAWYATWYATWYAAWNAALDAAWYTAWVAARGAACALVVRDLIGQYGFTQEHYDLLTGPWRTVIGPIHPDDEDLS